MNSTRNYQTELIRKFDRITFNIDLIKDIIKWRPDMDYHELRENFMKYGKDYGLKNWNFLPEEGDLFTVRNIEHNTDGDLQILPAISDKEHKYSNIGLTSGWCKASLIQRIFWYDNGNSRVVESWSEQPENSKVEDVIFVSMTFNKELFKSWNHLYYSRFVEHNQDTNQLIIQSYDKKKLNEMGLNLR